MDLITKPLLKVSAALAGTKQLKMIQTTVQHGAAMRDRLVSFSDPTSPSNKKRPALQLQDGDREKQDVQDGHRQEQDALGLGQDQGDRPGHSGGEQVPLPLPPPEAPEEVKVTDETGDKDREHVAVEQEATEAEPKAAEAAVEPKASELPSPMVEEPMVEELQQKTNDNGEAGARDQNEDGEGPGGQSLQVGLQDKNKHEALPESKLKDDKNEIDVTARPSPEDPQTTKSVDGGAGEGQQKGHDGKQEEELQPAAVVATTEVVTTTTAAHVSQVSESLAAADPQHQNRNPTTPTPTTTTRDDDVKNAETISVGSSDGHDEEDCVVTCINL